MMAMVINQKKKKAKESSKYSNLITFQISPFFNKSIMSPYKTIIKEWEEENKMTEMKPKQEKRK